MPPRKYNYFASDCPFRFEHHSLSAVRKTSNQAAEPCWLNIDYPYFDCTVHLSYKKIENNAVKYIEDARTLAYKHTLKATNIEEFPVIRDSAKVYGLIYSLEGSTASSLQFYLTDSSRHFIRGALYFNVAPNIDSLAPVLQYVRGDINRLINSFSWQE
jgi:gliding motility-associated lipoprotein GldD